MAKELYIYSGIYGFTAETVVKELNKISDKDDLTIRLNTPGGSTDAGWSIISKLSERKSKINGVIDGQASSMGAMMLVFMDNVVANDTSRIMFHKAAYPSWYEADAGELQTLKTINDQFKSKLEAKVLGKPKAQEFIDKVFENDVRNDVSLTPSEALELGIVNEVRTLQPSAYDFNTEIVAFADTKKETPSGENSNKPKFKKMDLAKLKAEHPAVYQAAFAEGQTEGQTQERNRVGAWAVYAEVNIEKVKAGIESGSQMTAKDMAEMNLEIVKGEKLKAEKEDNPADTTPPADAKTLEEIEAAKQQEEMDKLFGKETK